MLKRFTRNLLIVSALVAYLMLPVPSTPAQGTYLLSGKVFWNNRLSVVINPAVVISKWNGSSWVVVGCAYSNSCGEFYYHADGPGLFKAEVGSSHDVSFNASVCGSSDHFGYVSGWETAELSAASPSKNISIFTSE